MGKHRCFFFFLFFFLWGICMFMCEVLRSTWGISFWMQIWPCILFCYNSTFIAKILVLFQDAFWKILECFMILRYVCQSLMTLYTNTYVYEVICVLHHFMNSKDTLLNLNSFFFLSGMYILSLCLQQIPYFHLFH